MAIHFPSKLHKDSYEQDDLSNKAMEEIEELRKKESKSPICGDQNFNENPFETGMSSFAALHGVMCEPIATKTSRKVSGEKRTFFYKIKMWSLMGDESTGPPGSYYYIRSGGALNYYWNTLDQVLIRPSLLKDNHEEDVRYGLDVEGSSLLSSTGLNRDYSDHLPVLAKISS